MNCTFKSVLHIACLILEIENLRKYKEKDRQTRKLGKQNNRLFYTDVKETQGD